MTGALGIVDGAVGAPAIKFNNATTTGFYKTTTGFGATISGSLVAEFNSSGLVLSKTAALKDGGDTASASALTLGDGNIFNITGTTAITSIGSKGVGTVVWLRFNGILTLTHHATDLILTTGSNITTAAGDWAQFEEYASGDWRMLQYQRADGRPLTFETVASQSDVEAATSTTTLVTPGRAQYHPGVAKGWVVFDVSGNILSSHNVASVATNGTAAWIITWATDFSSASHCDQVTLMGSSGMRLFGFVNPTTTGAGATRVDVTDVNGTSTTTNLTAVMVVAYGDQ